MSEMFIKGKLYKLKEADTGYIYMYIKKVSYPLLNYEIFYFLNRWGFIIELASYAKEVDDWFKEVKL